MTSYDLPTTISIGGEVYQIRTDYRVVLDILIAWNDPDLDDVCKTSVMIQIMYIDWQTIPLEYMQEAADKACEFIDCGQRPSEKRNPKLIDWEQDASMIISAVNKVAHTEIRAVPYMHWWTFFSYFMEIGECMFSNILYYRSKKAKHKKLEKWEQEFYRENRELIEFRSQDERSEEEKQALAELWGI